MLKKNDLISSGVYGGRWPEDGERIRPTFINCPRCEGVGFILFESMGFVGFEEPIGLIRAKCEICGGDGEIIYKNPETQCTEPASE